MKYGKRIVNMICKLIESDDYTQREICKQVGINVDTFHDWRNNKPEFSEAIEKADKKRLEKFKAVARNSMMKKIGGYEFEEKHITMLPDSKGKPKIKEQKTIKKHVPPDSNLLMYVLNNTDPENFRHKEHREHTGKDGKDLIPDLSDEELLARINKITKPTGKD